MSVWAVIPAKSLRTAKTRLAPVLPPRDRAALARRLLDGALGAAVACPALAGTIVVSADDEAHTLAREHGAAAYPDPAPGLLDPLNAAIALGCRRAAESGAAAVLVLPADLPLLTPEAIALFLERAGDAAVALAPDRAGTGTNALLLRPPLALAPAFGPGSFMRHRSLALARGLAVATVSLPALACDLDTPADLALWSRYEARMADPHSAPDSAPHSADTLMRDCS